MFRSTHYFAITVAGLMMLSTVVPTPARGQNNPGTAEVAPGPQKPSRELWQLLTDWANGSASIKTLSGKHERHVYDDTFFVEKISNGEFFYEGPDKGRIDILEVQISEPMIARRNEPGARVERTPAGKPYELKTDDSTRWICDGTRVFEIDERQKQARVVNLPPTLRGQNIMNSPLPFLFGLPPEKALERFNMTLVEDARPENNYVRLSATPRLRQDADNWSSAEIFLDTQSFLPIAVKLVDPPKTKRTVYKFIDPKVNQNALMKIILNNKPFEPNLRGYQVQVIQPADGTEAPKPDIAANAPQMNQNAARPAAPVVPNVVGKAHNVAEQMLLDAGVSKDKIRKFKGGPAPRPDLKFLVSKQKPEPGTPLEANSEIHLLIFTEAQTAEAPGTGANR